MACKWDKGDGYSARHSTLNPSVTFPKNHVTHRIPERTYSEENTALSKLKARLLDIWMSLYSFSNIYKSQFLFKAIQMPSELKSLHDLRNNTQNGPGNTCGPFCEGFCEAYVWASSLMERYTCPVPTGAGLEQYEQQDLRIWTEHHPQSCVWNFPFIKMVRIY